MGTIAPSYDIWMFVLLSYGIAAAVLGGLCITAYLHYRKIKIQLKALEIHTDA
jgi:heme exporter protein CcmD